MHPVEEFVRSFLLLWTTPWRLLILTLRTYSNFCHGRTHEEGYQALSLGKSGLYQ